MKKTLKSQRKKPQQSRSKIIVDAIFEATIRILPKLGSQNVTTKKIADLAGVSVGSLYQYFPNKESVLAAVMDVAMKKTSEEAEQKLKEIEGKSIQESTKILVDFALEIFLTDKEKNREIYRQAPELGRVPALMRLRQSFIQGLASIMETHAPQLSLEKRQRVSFVAVSSVMGVIHTMLYDETREYSRDELSVELCAMITAYFLELMKIE